MVLYILLFPVLIFAQDTAVINTHSKQLMFSFQYGAKMYNGNMLLEERRFSREGVFAAFTFFTKKEVTKKVNIISRSSLSLSNAIAKEIDIIMPEINIDFTTKIPNILACNINYSLEINKHMNKFLNHGIALKFRLYPLFYKKGQIFNNEIHSLGGLISSEENGSLPDLEKSTKVSYEINYWLSDLTSFGLSIFVYSNWKINNRELYPLYPGVVIKFETILNQDFRPPWARNKKTFNK